MTLDNKATIDVHSQHKSKARAFFPCTTRNNLNSGSSLTPPPQAHLTPLNTHTHTHTADLHTRSSRKCSTNIMPCSKYNPNPHTHTPPLSRSLTTFLSSHTPLPPFPPKKRHHDAASRRLLKFQSSLVPHQTNLC